MADTDLILMCLHKSVLKKRKEVSNIYTLSMLHRAEGIRVDGIFSLVNTQNPTGSQTQCLQQQQKNKNKKEWWVYNSLSMIPYSESPHGGCPWIEKIQQTCPW